MAVNRGSTATDWSIEFDTLRREKLFRTPPADHTAYPALQAAVMPHIESFNAILEPGGLMELALEDIGEKVWSDQRDGGEGVGNLLRIKISKVSIGKPEIPRGNTFSTTNRRVYPAECRERHVSYKAKLSATLRYKIANGTWQETTRELGLIPVMLKSSRCHLEGLSPEKLVACKEESEELGGYFIVNGNERLIRMLLAGRRNFPLAIIRPSFKNRGSLFSHFGILIRCCRPDQSSHTNALHYLNDGNVIFRFSWRKAEYQIPVMMILKALIDTNDREIFENIVGPASSSAVKNTFLTDRVEMLLRTYKTYNLYDKKSTRKYLGEKFGIKLKAPENMTDEQLGGELLRKIVLVHLGIDRDSEAQNQEKFKSLTFMIRKLYALVAGDCAVDSPDALSNQEVLLGGFLYGIILKERLDDWLGQARDVCRMHMASKGQRFTSPDFRNDFEPKILSHTTENIGSTLEHFLSTGNLVSSTGLDLQDTSGYTIMAEKINFYRFISHFRMVHRGSFFAQLRTTAVRKLLPESWGFMCPVHTPDGGPCGLLNHLAHKCRIITKHVDASKVPDQIMRMGVASHSFGSMNDCVVVQLDGRILGWCSPSRAKEVADALRLWKVSGQHGIPLELEIGYIPNSNGGQYPGIYMSSQRSRMIRPVKYLPLGKEDLVGPLEQPHMGISVTEPEIIIGQHTHVEINPTNILSILANMTPFSDHNQSPRNMYQCQMGKQAMGTYGTSIRYRTDNKAYRLQTGQTPVVRSPLYNAYGLDNFPNGMNAVVAVISYTGYDMDDAMIINKSALERGFGHGSIYKTKYIDLGDSGNNQRFNRKPTQLFGFAEGGDIPKKWRETVDNDGLPMIGAEVKEGTIIACSYNVTVDSLGRFINRDKITVPHKYSDPEIAYVEEVRIIGSENGDAPLSKISIKLRIPRAPIIGDKFSSRHGQKGVCSQKWPQIDMPFSESGIVPDVIINPHAFPSRMTIGMFVESLAGKSGALHGLAQDCTPWTFDEQNPAHEFFGEQLRVAGFNKYGNEPMYSGITGEEFAADIYIGVVYYQRLRHMVNDKFQVRTTGPVTRTMGQPVKGRAKGGGIRVGEMERDSLLAHGAAFLLQDRLMNCSDYMKSWICTECGSFAGCTPTVSEITIQPRGLPKSVRCRRCARAAEFGDLKSTTWEDGLGNKFSGGNKCTVVAVPGALKYLVAELGAMGIALKFDVGVKS